MYKSIATYRDKNYDQPHTGCIISKVYYPIDPETWAKVEFYKHSKNCQDKHSYSFLKREHIKAQGKLDYLFYE